MHVPGRRPNDHLARMFAESCETASEKVIARVGGGRQGSARAWQWPYGYYGYWEALAMLSPAFLSLLKLLPAIPGEDWLKGQLQSEL